MSYFNKLSARMTLIFGTLLLTVAGVVTFASSEFLALHEQADKLAKEDLVKVEAVRTIDTTTRANAIRAFELIESESEQERNGLHDAVQQNRARVGASLETLERLVRLPRGKVLLGEVQARRQPYLAAYDRIDRSIRAGQRQTALRQMHEEMLPALGRLQESIQALETFQADVSTSAVQRLESEVQTARLELMATAVVALLLGIVGAWWVTRSVTRPLTRAVRLAQQIADGNLAAFELPKEGPLEVQQLQVSLQHMSAQLRATVYQVRQSADSIETASSEISVGNLDLGQRTEQQAAALQETAAALEQVAATAHRNAGQAKHANELATSAARLAEQGGQTVGRFVGTMRDIEQSATEISSIVSVIDTIAFQTNMLALNAAVEAAHAGAHGRGFAVVANEVRALSKRCADAAGDIKGRVAHSARHVQVGRDLVDDAMASVQEIIMAVTEVSGVVGDISVASLQQAQGVHEVNRAMSELDVVTQSNAALVEESAAAATSLKQQAESLVGEVAVFQL